MMVCGLDHSGSQPFNYYMGIINVKCIIIYRAGAKRKLTRWRWLLHSHTVIILHIIIPSPSKSTTQALYSPVYNIGLVSLIYLGWELLLLCVA